MGNIDIVKILHIFELGKKINIIQKGKTPMFNHK
jgi:hypothetical protein